MLDRDTARDAPSTTNNELGHDQARRSRQAWQTSREGWRSSRLAAEARTMAAGPPRGMDEPPTLASRTPETAGEVPKWNLNVDTFSKDTSAKSRLSLSSRRTV